MFFFLESGLTIHRSERNKTNTRIMLPWQYDMAIGAVEADIMVYTDRKA